MNPDDFVWGKLYSYGNATLKYIGHVYVTNQPQLVFKVISSGNEWMNGLFRKRDLHSEISIHQEYSFLIEKDERNPMINKFNFYKKINSTSDQMKKLKQLELLY